MADIPSSIIHPVQAKHYGNLRKKGIDSLLETCITKNTIEKISRRYSILVIKIENSFF